LNCDHIKKPHLFTPSTSPAVTLPFTANQNKNQSHYRLKGPEGSRKLRFPDYVTIAQDCGKVVSLMHQPPLPPGNTPGTHLC